LKNEIDTLGGLLIKAGVKTNRRLQPVCCWYSNRLRRQAVPGRSTTAATADYQASWGRTSADSVADQQGDGRMSTHCCLSSVSTADLR
jgi:hypothetical protein